jgi:hypothetical protein
MPSITEFSVPINSETENMPGNKDNDDIAVVAKEAPVTKERVPATYTKYSIKDPGVARADVAVSIDKPNGDQEWASKVGDHVRSPTATEGSQRT